MAPTVVNEIPAVGTFNASGVIVGVGVSSEGDVCLQVENLGEEVWMGANEARILIALLTAAVEAKPGDYV